MKWGWGGGGDGMGWDEAANDVLKTTAARGGHNAAITRGGDCRAAVTRHVAPAGQSVRMGGTGGHAFTHLVVEARCERLEVE